MNIISKSLLLPILYDKLKNNEFKYYCGDHTYDIDKSFNVIFGEHNEIKIYYDNIIIRIHTSDGWCRYNYTFIELEYEYKHILELIYSMWKKHLKNHINTTHKLILETLSKQEIRKLKLNQIL